MRIRVFFKLLLSVFLFFNGYIIHGQSDTSWIEKIKVNLEDKYPLELSTSIESKYGHRVVEPINNQSSAILGEVRWQVGINYFGNWSETKATTDIFFDGVFGQLRQDLRELNIDIYPQNWWNLKLGRQALTWGKGDLVFINDLFPKDFRSFFSGRDIQYLKAPSDAIKLTINPSWVQLNVIYTPQFDADRSPLGRRISFYDAGFMEYRTEDYLFPVIVPSDYFSEDELAWRLQKNIAGYDFAAYGYYGYWKSPFGFDPTQKSYVHNNLKVHGFSVDGSLLGGILAIEAGYYHSSEDAEGVNPLIRNSEWRWLFNYNKDFTGSWSVGLQYYSEIISNYDAYKANLGGGTPLDQVQDMLTFRLRKLSHNQRIEWSFFAFYSIANQDAYIRPRIAYKLTDKWKIDIGSNIFTGKESYTLWNNFNTNNNIYLGLKWAI